MLQSLNSRHDCEDACHRHAVANATLVSGDHGLFTAGLASSWFAKDVPAVMDRSVAVNYGCYDPSPTPVTFQTSPSLLPPDMYHATAMAVGKPHYYTSTLQNHVESTPPYLIGDRRLPPEVLDRRPSGAYGGTSVQYRDAKLAVMGGTVADGELRSSADDCSMRSVMFASDARMRTPSNLTPPPSVFAWHGSQTGCSSSTPDHELAQSFRSYYTNIVVDQPSCRSPIGADAAVDVCEGLQQAMAGANTVRSLPRETRRRGADRGGATMLSRRPRTNFTAEQLCRLRQCFADCQYIDVHQRAKLAAALGLTETQVKVWFQNQRTKMRRLQRTGDDVTSQLSTDNCLFSHSHHHQLQQQRPAVSMTTEENNASLADQLDPLTSSPNKMHSVLWRPK